MLSVIAPAQTVEQIKADRNTYLWGEGTGPTLKSADQDALNSLISQISVHVESQFTVLKEETEKAGKSNFTEQAKLVMSTYSNASLTSTERVVLDNEPNARVFRYIRRADVRKVFEQRKIKIMDFMQIAEESLRKYQIADALRYSNWALTLLRSHPDGSSMTYTTHDGQQRILLTYLPAFINDIIAMLRFAALEIADEGESRYVTIGITAGGVPVSNFDYTYWDGMNWSTIVSAQDGRGTLEFHGGTAKLRTETQIRSEYEFEGEARADREIEEVMKRLNPMPFPKAIVNLKFQNSQPAEQVAVATKAIVTPSVPATLPIADIKLSQVSNPKFYEDITKQIVESLKTRNFDGIKKFFTTDGYDVFTKLLNYGQARLISMDNIRTIKFGETVICRGAKMNFAFQNNTRKFIEEVVFHFNANNKIEYLTFGLGDVATASILGRTAWSETDRLTIINFLENYKTAYALKRLDYISSIFADNALIIVGNVVQQSKQADNPFAGNKIVQYNRLSKQQYINQLRMSFASKEFINIKFEDSDIRKSGRGEGVFGIQIKQNYHSSNYGDEGYLFLLIDLSQANKPTINIRTWQPEKNPDGSIYGIEDF